MNRFRRLLWTLLSVAAVHVHNTAAAADSSVPVGSKATPNPEPFSRRLAIPPLKLLPPGQTTPIVFEPRAWRFSHVCVVGTWNKQSQVVFDYYSTHKDFFEKYKIAAVAAFSHDTKENLAAWAAQAKPTWLYGLAQTEFVDRLENPKVPTCWVLSREGQILLKHENPTPAVLGSVYHKLKLWTDF